MGWCQYETNPSHAISIEVLTVGDQAATPPQEPAVGVDDGTEVELPGGGVEPEPMLLRMLSHLLFGKLRRTNHALDAKGKKKRRTGCGSVSDQVRRRCWLWC